MTDWATEKAWKWLWPGVGRSDSLDADADVASLAAEFDAVRAAALESADDIDAVLAARDAALAERDQLRRDLEQVRDTTGRVPIRHVTYEDGAGLTWKNVAEMAEAERDRLAAQVAALRLSVEALERTRNHATLVLAAVYDDALGDRTRDDAINECGQLGSTLMKEASAALAKIESLMSTEEATP